MRQIFIKSDYRVQFLMQKLYKSRVEIQIVKIETILLSFSAWSFDCAMEISTFYISFNQSQANRPVEN